ncbi:hypothetical protein THC_1671 [Caldimicrobium thiodismutans]|uniref:TolB N-terminal domain-containing protein n=1 Tax=Caldimicrobium thiodismutans TaxID=1653476 RepID=A0A0U5AZV0_9BACT|nr:PD40 domain-containing protein [Caldimicrobium thiodismutans]BAU24031.1 hypothetical protein THC_1671 [Caldimicrobium thiodismutans]
MKLKLLILLIFLINLALPSGFAQNEGIITITPQSYSKVIIRIPPLEGDSGDNAGELLRNLLNYHLFCLALKEPPLTGFKNKEFYLKGKITSSERFFNFSGELWDVYENKPLKKYSAEGSSLERLIYAIADQIIQDISPYRGVSETRFAFVKRTSTGDNLYIMDFSKRNLRKIRSSDLILFPKFSGSGKQLAYIVYEREHYFLEIYSLITRERKKLEVKGLSSAPLWLPDEKSLILTLGKNDEINIYQFFLETQKLIPLTSGKGVHQAGSLSSNGKYLAYVADTSGRPQVYLLNLETLKPQRISFEGKHNTAPRISPKGNLLLYVSSSGGDRTLVLYNLKTGEKKSLSIPYTLTDPSFSPSGDFLIFKGKGKKGGGIYLMHLDSLLIYPYLPFENLYYPDWGKLF